MLLPASSQGRCTINPFSRKPTGCILSIGKAEIQFDEYSQVRYALSSVYSDDELERLERGERCGKEDKALVALLSLA